MSWGLAVIAGAAAGAVGYLLGVRKGDALRDELARKAAEHERRAAECEQRASAAEAQVATLSSEGRDGSERPSQQALAESLRQIPQGHGRTELPRILDAIAERAGLSALVLSDERGLTVGSSRHATNSEALAALASGLLTLSERFERVGAPRPQAFVVHDDANQVVVHRIFTVEDSDYLLSAVSNEQPLSRVALDAALEKIEGLMARGVPLE